MKAECAATLGFLCALLVSAAWAQQSDADLAVLRGLAPVTVLLNTPEGMAALGANYRITGGIQTGAIGQRSLLPFAQQQEQALRDADITGGDLVQLADGLGTTLGAAYLARAHYLDQSHFTNVSPAVAAVIACAEAASGMHSNAAKYLFANATTDGKTPVSAQVMSIIDSVGGKTDIFGKSYLLPAGAPGADAYGNSRPFQTEPTILPITGPNYFGVAADNGAYTHGPIMNLTNSPSYPSGHATYGYTGALILAVWVPARYAQMIARAAEYGNDRIVLGAHYAMDVIGGRTLALYDVAHLLANDPAYLHRALQSAPSIKDFQGAMTAARAEVTKALQAACGKTVQECSREDIGRLSNPAENAALYDSTQTYGLPVVYPKFASELEDVSQVAPEAGYLLRAAFPTLTLEAADRILTETEGPGGGFLDNGSAFGVYSRLNLYAAAVRAAALAAPPTQ